MNSSTISVIDMCLSGLRGLHPQLDEVIPAGTLQDPTTVTISSITITTGDGMPRMRTFRETKTKRLLLGDEGGVVVKGGEDDSAMMRMVTGWCGGRGDVVDGGCGGGRSVPERLKEKERR
ncbi:hypothetical protein Tco_0024879 [Tanacetum coccineum]